MSQLLQNANVIYLFVAESSVSLTKCHSYALSEFDAGVVKQFCSKKVCFLCFLSPPALIFP